MNIYNQFT